MKGSWMEKNTENLDIIHFCKYYWRIFVEKLTKRKWKTCVRKKDFSQKVFIFNIVSLHYWTGCMNMEITSLVGFTLTGYPIWMNPSGFLSYMQQQWKVLLQCSQCYVVCVSVCVCCSQVQFLGILGRDMQESRICRSNGPYCWFL